MNLQVTQVTGFRGEREEESDERVWQDSLSYTTPVTQLLCKGFQQDSKPHTKNTPLNGLLERHWETVTHVK